MVTVAREAGADAIKFQIYDTDRLFSSADVTDTYKVLVDRETGRMETLSESAKVSFRHAELSRPEWKAVKEHADREGIAFFATVCHEDDVDFLMEAGVEVFKIASGDVNHLDFISYVARTGKVVMLDTGTSTIGDIEEAVDAIRKVGNERIVIHHCPSGYPARLESINLRVITTLNQMFDYPVAFSDHSPGWEMDIAAVALGAHMVEKTISRDRMIRAPEHVMSVDFAQARPMVLALRELEVALGSSRRIMTAKEEDEKVWKRRSAFAKRSLRPGETFLWDDADFRRPGEGIPPNLAPLLVGRALRRAVDAGQMLSWDDFSAEVK
jgi:sialic acid synthase SpsE